MLTESIHAGAFLISEEDGHISRDAVTIVSGQNLVAGAVLGKITSGGKYAAYDNNASDGTQTAAAILYAACDATAGDTQATAITRMAEVNGKELTWSDNSPSSDVTAGIADLAVVHIIVR